MTIASFSVQDRPGGVHSAIAVAAARTGMDFSYLLGQAQVESAMRPDARAATSSAEGLYQFIDQSWLGIVQRHGAAHGLGWAAEAISTGPGGRFHVADPGLRRAILDLRRDPRTAALMAAEHAADNKAELEARFGRDMGPADLYMAHFLGLGGARRFIAALDSDPDQPAARMFPAAAAANRGVFFAPDGRARSVAEIHGRFAERLQRGARLAGGGNPLPDMMPDLAAAPPARFARAVMPPAAAADADARTTLDDLLARGRTRDSLLRPRPDTARLAYLMLAGMGG